MDIWCPPSTTLTLGSFEDLASHLEQKQMKRERERERKVGLAEDTY